MATKKTKFKFWKLVLNGFAIARTAKELYEKVLDISKDPGLRFLAARLKRQVEEITK